MCTYVVSDFNGEEILDLLQKRIAKNKSKRFEKVIRRKDDKLYAE